MGDKAYRKRGLGGTDLAAILGVSPWRTPLQVYLDKIGEGPKRAPSEWMKWGLRIEPLIAAAYTERTGLVTTPAEFRRIPGKEYLLVSPDFDLPDTNGVGGLETKCSGLKTREWGEPGTDEIPEPYLIQTHWQMHVCSEADGAEREWADVAVLFAARRLEVYRVPRNTSLEGMLREAAERFWRDHVRCRKPPEPTAGDAKPLLYLHPKDNGKLLPSNPTVEKVAMEIREVEQVLGPFNERLEGLKNQMRAMIGDDLGFRGHWGKATWRRANDTVGVDYAAYAEALEGLVGELWDTADKDGDPDELLEVVREKHTKVLKRGGRRLSVNHREVS